MSNILVITPIYKIIGRNEIFRDTECVHDLIKNWRNIHNIHVVIPYSRGLKDIIKFLNPKLLKYYFNGYNYMCDDIPVTILEKQNIFPKQVNGSKIDKFRFNNILKKELESKKFEPNIIIVHIPSASRFFIQNKIYDYHKIAVLHYSDVKYLKKKGKSFIKFLKDNYKKVFCRSEAIYKEFKKYDLNNLSDEIIYSGVPDIITNEEIIDLKFKKQKNQILYVGKLIERKKLDVLIKALSKIDNKTWDLNVIGKGPMLNKYQDIVKQLKLESNVHFLGTYPKKEVFNYMEKADIFCMPSIKETLGLVYIEAMSRGCITIGTKNEGIDGIIKNDINGYLTDCDENLLYNLLLNIFKLDLEKKREISKKAIETAKFYNENDMSDRYLKLINGVINDEKN